MKRRWILWLAVGIGMGAGVLEARELHVAVSGDDGASGDAAAPLRTIQAAAEQARPGDTITVHSGIYRERVDPPRGGKSDAQRIVFQAAPGAEVTIKGSEVVKGWEKVENDTWKAIIPNELFGESNPYRTPIAGDWFHPLPRGSRHTYHTGTVYLDGHWLREATSKAEVLAPAGDDTLWFAEVDESKTTIFAQFKGLDPRDHTIEINVREAVFYPEKPGIDYITVRGFTLEHAAPNWAPPTAEQVGLIGTHWSKGWIIEDNTIRYSICTGVTLGKHGDEFDNTSQDSAEGYVETIKRGLAAGWSRQNIGSHLVRNNHISHCEQAGIVGSLGAAFSTITGNVVHDINRRGMLGGAEMAGIKFHGAVDTVIARNHIHRCGGSGGIWLDWMTQGTRVTANLLHDNERQDLFVEVNHGPFLVDHNLFLSPIALRDWSTGGAYVHNLFAGVMDDPKPQGRKTPYLKAHATEIAGLHDIPCGDNRFLNNLFVGGHNLDPYSRFENMTMEGNRFSEAEVELVREEEGIAIRLESSGDLSDGGERRIVTTGTLGRTVTSGLPFQQADGSDYRIDTDYFGKARDAGNPAAGPFAQPFGKGGPVKVWPGR